MIYVGIDIAKLDHYASAIDSDGVVLIEPFKFRNDADGFHTLSSRLKSLPSGDKVIIGLESTAHYGNNLVRYLVFRSYDDLDLKDLKLLGRFRQKAIKQRTRLKIQLKSSLDQTFPELQYFFKSGLHQKGVYALLREALTAKGVASMQ